MPELFTPEQIQQMTPQQKQDAIAKIDARLNGLGADTSQLPGANVQAQPVVNGGQAPIATPEPTRGASAGFRQGLGIEGAKPTAGPMAAFGRGIGAAAKQFQRINDAELGLPAETSGTTGTDLAEFEAKERAKAQIKSEFDKSEKATSGLDPNTEVRARALARKIAGVRGAEKILPAIVESIKAGQTIDEIEDSIRIGSQSPEFTGPVRSAAQQILQNSPDRVFQRTLDTIDDELTLGNQGKVKSLLRRTARNQAGVDESKAVRGKERTIEFLGEIQTDLDALAESGVDTNIFSGTAEEANAKIGRVLNPAVRKVATKIQTAIQNYRKALSGVAFSVPEAKEYKMMFPGISRTAEFNKANINALQEVMNGDVSFFYGQAMGPENYNSLFGETEATLSQPTQETPQPVQQVTSFNSVQEAEAANLPVGTQITIGGRTAVVE